MKANTAKPLSPARQLLLGGLTILGILGLVCFAFLPRSTGVYKTPNQSLRYDLLEVSILRPELVEWLPYMLLAGMVLLLVVGILLLAFRRIRIGIFFLLGTLLFSALAWGLGAYKIYYGWMITDQITGKDGKLYSLLSTNSHGRAIVIGRPNASRGLYNRFEVLVTNNDATPLSYVPIIRPEPIKENRSHALYANSEGLLCGTMYENRCFVAYDVPKARAYGRESVEQLSPYLLLDEKSPIHAADEESILETIRSGKTVGLPTSDSLKGALAHPNPFVQQSAAKLLKAMGEGKGGS